MVAIFSNKKNLNLTFFGGLTFIADFVLWKSEWRRKRFHFAAKG